MDFDWKSTLATVAPTIASALGGPLAGIAVSMATNALGLDNNEQALAEAITSGNPDILLAMRKADNDFKLKLKELDVDLERIHAGDRDSARKMAAATTLAPQVTIAAIFIIGFVGVLYAVFGGGVVINEGMKDASMYLLGILSAGIMQILNFMYGSSSGSHKKNDVLAKLKDK